MLILIEWDASLSPYIEIIFYTCIDMRLSISWARGDRPCWGWWDVKIVIWARGNRPCGKLFDIMIVRWDRPHRHVEIVRVGIWTSRVPHGSWTLDVFPRSIMYIRLRVYWVFWDNSLHGVILNCISSHHLFWWLCVLFGVWKILDVWLPLLMKPK